MQEKCKNFSLQHLSTERNQYNGLFYFLEIPNFSLTPSLSHSLPEFLIVIFHREGGVLGGYKKIKYPTLPNIFWENPQMMGLLFKKWTDG